MIVDPKGREITLTPAEVEAAIYAYVYGNVGWINPTKGCCRLGSMDWRWMDGTNNSGQSVVIDMVGWIGE